MGVRRLHVCPEYGRGLLGLSACMSVCITLRAHLALFFDGDRQPLIVIGHPSVRSTTQRHRPSLSRDSTPYRAIRAAIPRRRSQTRCAREAYARSACSLPGRLRARLQSPLTAGMASTSGIRYRESCTWAPEIFATGSAENAAVPVRASSSEVSAVASGIVMPVQGNRSHASSKRQVTICSLLHPKKSTGIMYASIASLSGTLY